MALSTGRHIGTHNGTWFEEQATLINSVSDQDLSTMSDKFDERFESAAHTMARQYKGLNIMRDAQRMLQNEAIMESYKTEFLNPILEEIRSTPVRSTSEEEHMEQVAIQLEQACSFGVIFIVWRAVIIWLASRSRHDARISVFFISLCIL